MIVLLGLAANAFAATPDKVYPVETDPDAEAKRRKATAYLLSLSEEEMLAIVPAQSGIYFTDCPNCESGSQDRGKFAWSPERPGEIVCQGCAERYPDNPKHPDGNALEVPGPDGPHQYPYYERPEDGYRIYFRAHADYWARDYMASRCRDLAELYWTTRDEMCARRSAQILIRFAELYPGYALHYDNAFREKKFAPYTQKRIRDVPHGSRSAKWDWWAYMDLSEDLARAYDCLRDWPNLAGMAEGRAMAMVETDLLGAMVSSVLGFEESYNNMSPYVWRDVIYAGRILRRPDWVHEAVRRLEHFTSERFLHDGHWMETSPSYCRQVVGILERVLAALDGYSDPVTYRDAKDGRRLDGAGLADVLAVGPRLHYVLGAPRFPNGRRLPVNDTWWSDAQSPREQMQSVLMPGLGVAVMGGGEGEHQVHAYLNFTSGSRHKHKDALSLGLFAFGKELLADVGYTHVKHRAWALSAMSHNTVVVNGRDSEFDPDHTGNRLRAFATDGRGFHLAEAESLAAYPKDVTRFRRTLVTVGADSRDCYVLDLFQIDGGEQHDYLLHGSADDDSHAVVTGTELTPFTGSLLNSGVPFVFPEGEHDRGTPETAYGFVHGLSRGPARGTVALEMRLDKSPDIGTRTLLLAQKDTVIYLGQAPSLRRARKVDADVGKYQAPLFCARRKGKALSSLFIAVHEPLNGAPTVEGVTARELKGGVLVTVNRGHSNRDLFVMAFDEAIAIAAETEDGRLDFDGLYGLVRVRGGRSVESHLVGGKLLALEGLGTTGPSGWRGDIRKVHRGAGRGSRGYFEVAETLNPASTGGAFIVEFPDKTVRAYNIVHMEGLKNGTRVHVREDPGYTVTTDGIDVCAYPQRHLQGTRNTYSLMNTVHKVDGVR